jgi:hypothetical protein
MAYDILLCGKVFPIGYRTQNFLKLIDKLLINFLVSSNIHQKSQKITPQNSEYAKFTQAKFASATWQINQSSYPPK